MLLPFKRKVVRRHGVTRAQRYVSLGFGLTKEQARTLKEASQREVITESAVLRKMLDVFLAEVDKRGLDKVYGKGQIVGYEEKVVPRTIGKEQDQKLRQISRQTGRSMSSLIREAIERFHGSISNTITK